MTAAAEAAARVGLMLARPRASTMDALEVLQELGGSGTVYDVQKHVGRGSVSTVHARYQKLIPKGLITVSGAGSQLEPFRYCMTSAAEILLGAVCHD